MKVPAMSARLWILAALTAAVLTADANRTSAAVPDSADRVAITSVMAQYSASLNAADAVQSIVLYADDAVLMVPYGPSVVGKTVVRAAYEQGSKLFVLHVTFTIDEIVQTAPDWAFVRTSSTGTLESKATGQNSPEANQELFILRKGPDLHWRIARYSFSPTVPPTRPTEAQP